MKQKTYKELLDGIKYSELGYTGAQPIQDAAFKAFNDTILKNDEISKTKINNSPLFKGQRRSSGGEAKTGTAVDTVGGTSPTTVPTTQPETATPLTIDAKYSDFTKWAQEHGVDSDKVFQDAMALARTQYEQSRATYGLQAEQLAQAGLTNSGVSDNLERAAYAQKVQAEQAALDQKAALDLANKQGYAEYQEQQKQQQQQYTNLYQQLVDGYEDEYGNIHAGVSPEMAVAQLKFAGLTDETMIAEAQKAYGEYKSVYDQQQTDRQNAIAGIDSTTGGFSADSMFGKLLSGDMTSEEFLNTIEADYGERFSTDEEAVDALLAGKLITKDMASMFYREIAYNSLEAIAEAGINPRKDLKDDDGDLYNVIKEASEAYKSGKMTKADWDDLRKSIINGTGKVKIEVDTGAANWSDYLYFNVTFGDKSTKITVANGVTRRVEDQTKSAMLDKIAVGDYAVYDGELYIKANKTIEKIAGTSKAYESVEKPQWLKVGRVSGTKKHNVLSILKLLAE